jgi:predicted nucleic acid-binding protein
MKIREVILDAGPLVAVLSARDDLHAWARQLFSDLPLPCVTCEAVLSEAFFRLRHDENAMMALSEMIDGGAFQVTPIGSLSAVGRCVIRYRVDFADACLVALSEQFPNATVVTTDRRDFSVLRRFGKERIPFLAPSP